MKKFYSLVVLTTVLGISIASVSAQQTSGPAPTQAQVQAKLRYLFNYGVFDNITVAINGSTVTLDGKVSSLSTRSEAEKVVEKMAGVTRVINNIDQLPPSPADDRIRRAALITFLNRGPAQYFSERNPDVRIIVENSRITLEGVVSRESDSNTLNILAHGLSGVFQVTNNLVVGRRLS